MLMIYNTLSREKQKFIPIQAGTINLYVCGVTVYDYCHLGHARTYTALDVIIRYLRFRNYAVTYVRNITDIDDKIIKRAQESQEECATLTERFINAMHADFAALQLLPPDHEPRATAYISHMIQLITQLIDKKAAYPAANGDVYFSVRHFPEYGCLSHHDLAQMQSGVRVEVNEQKQDPLDFVLWKSSKAGEPAWDSPWGKGRPGWHIECSAMAMDLLGEHFDIHAGGRDLIFPHHENEIAQTQACTHKAWVNFWLHTGFLQIDQEKMSKSLGNFITIRDALKEQDAEVLRFLFTASHYRSPLIYSSDALFQASQSLDRLYTALRFFEPAERAAHTSYEKQFLQAMDDDFNTPIALAVLFELAHHIQRLRERDQQQAKNHAALLKHLAGILGLLQKDPEHYFQSGKQGDLKQIQELIAQREIARQEKNWAEADRLRDELARMNIILEDGPKGVSWKYLKP